MSESKIVAVPTLVVRRTFKAPRTRVYAAWTQPELLKKWFGPPGYSIPKAELHVVVGGAYRITMLAPDGENHIVRGVFREVREPERIAYTWRWEQSPYEDAGTTLVTLDFFERGEETELVLAHAGFANPAAYDRHEHGWNALFQTLVGVL